MNQKNKINYFLSSKKGPLERTPSAESHGWGWRETRQYKRADAVATAASQACQCEGPTSRRHGPWAESSGTRPLRLPLKKADHPSLQKIPEGDARRSNLPESEAGKRPTTKTTTSESET